MSDRLSKIIEGRVTRRGLFETGGLAALLGAGAVAAPEPAQAALEIGPNLYESIGVRPVINAKGTFTIMSGSLSLPEVKQAMMEASKHYVHIDELMAAVGKRIAELAKCESAIVTCGCASALVHATSACIAGGNPELMQRLPDLTGMKDEVIAPVWSRNVYDHAVRMLGVKMINVHDLDEMRAALGPKTAMVSVMANPSDTGPFGLEPVAKLAHEFGVPVIVDAAAEDFNPSVHFDRGADMVAYSGGKALRGPQSAGVLLGKKELIRAAWMNSSPHHAFGRPMKIGKEDIMGMLAAVEMWFKRDHEAERKRWREWLDTIATSVKRVNGVKTEVLEPRGLSNNTPRLEITWDSEKLGLYGEDLNKMFWDGTPRIILGGASGNARRGGESSATIVPWMMEPGNAEVVGDELYKALSNPPKMPKVSKAKPADVDGVWDVWVDFVLQPGTQQMVNLEQDFDDLRGMHHGDRTDGEVRGYVTGDTVRFSSRHRWEGASFGFNFEGKVSGDVITGEVDMGEYFTAPFTAKRHEFGRRQPPQRPVKNV